MKTNPFIWFIFLLLGTYSVYSFVQIGRLNSEIVALNKKNNQQALPEASHPESETKNEKDETGEADDLEIVHYMNRIQSFHAKLYAAGKNNNKQLMGFYLHEIEEEMETIAEGKIIEDGVNISDNMVNFGLNQVKRFETEMETSTFNFEKSFQDLTVSCNSCHNASSHDYIRITVPSGVPVSNQDFR